MHFLKKIITLAVICTIGYFILGYHYIILDSWFPPSMLKKSKLTLQYTVFNTKGKEMTRVMSIPELWNDGIGELLLKEGKITEDQLEMQRQKMEGEDEEY